MPHIPVWIVAKESLRFRETRGARRGVACLTADKSERSDLAATVANAAMWMSGLSDPAGAVKLLRFGRVESPRGAYRPVLAYRVISRTPGPPTVVLGVQGFAIAMFPADAELICLLSDLLRDTPRRAASRRRVPPPRDPDPLPRLAKGSRTPKPDQQRQPRPAPIRIVPGGLPGLGKNR